MLEQLGPRKSLPYLPHRKSDGSLTRMKFMTSEDVSKNLLFKEKIELIAPHTDASPDDGRFLVLGVNIGQAIMRG